MNRAPLLNGVEIPEEATPGCILNKDGQVGLSGFQLSFFAIV
jgi:hypothetical protein